MRKNNSLCKSSHLVFELSVLVQQEGNRFFCSLKEIALTVVAAPVDSFNLSKVFRLVQFSVERWGTIDGMFRDFSGLFWAKLTVSHVHHGL